MYLSEAIKLVRTRAEAMQLVSELEPGGMATVILGPTSKLSDAIVKAKEWCTERGISNPECRVATYLSPHMKVISGHTEVSLVIMLVENLRIVYHLLFKLRDTYLSKVTTFCLIFETIVFDLHSFSPAPWLGISKAFR